MLIEYNKLYSTTKDHSYKSSHGLFYYWRLNRGNMGLMLDKQRGEIAIVLYLKRFVLNSDLCILIYFKKLHALGVSTVLNRNMLQSIPLVFKISFNQTLNKKKIKKKN